MFELFFFFQSGCIFHSAVLQEGDDHPMGPGMALRLGTGAESMGAPLGDPGGSPCGADGAQNDKIPPLNVGKTLGLSAALLVKIPIIPYQISVAK